jgi:ABC-type transport system involved in cytochrome bd biosynthesis fused ATPase/permease subunit
MAEYQRSLIRQHEMNIVPQLQYYRSQYDRANAGLEKAEYDKSIANINAASQAAQGAINAVAAGGSMLGNGTNVTDGTNTTNVTTDANGTPIGTIDAKKVVDPTTPAYNPLLDEYQLA